jgi:hypothetical protein
MAPAVTISPWAKFVRPVVPKINERPTEHIAIIRPSRTPSANRWEIRSTSPSSALWLLPVKRLTIRFDVRNESTLINCSPGVSAESSSPSGRESSSTLTV